MRRTESMDCQLDIFFLEAILNGLLLAGLLALLALGLNLIFGVIDVVWICYAELVMVGMYGIHYAYKGGTPFLARRAVRHRADRARRRAAALARHPPGARFARRSTSCSSPAACCSSCRPPPRWCSASTSRISASGSAPATPSTCRSRIRASSRSASRSPRCCCCGCSCSAPTSASRSARSRRTGRSCR